MSGTAEASPHAARNRPERAGYCGQGQGRGRELMAGGWMDGRMEGSGDSENGEHCLLCTLRLPHAPPSPLAPDSQRRRRLQMR